MFKRTANPKVAARVLTLFLASIGLQGCSEVLDPAGPVGIGERLILIDCVAIMLCVVVPVILLALAFSIWFRRSNKNAIFRPDFVYSGRVELVTWSIPLLTILFLSGIAWIGSHDLDPGTPLSPRSKPLEVQVVSLDWKWLFIYPEEGIAAVNMLPIPAGRPVHFTLTSASVMNSFFVPRLGSMIYTMNGMTNQLFLRADKPGHYAGRSTHFSGDGFSDMHFGVDAMTPQAFEGWVKAAKEQGPSLDYKAYANLSRQSTNVAPFTYRAVAPALFRDVVDQKIAPAPGPAPTAQPPKIAQMSGGH